MKLFLVIILLISGTAMAMDDDLGKLPYHHSLLRDPMIGTIRQQGVERWKKLLNKSCTISDDSSLLYYLLKSRGYEQDAFWRFLEDAKDVKADEYMRIKTEMLQIAEKLKREYVARQVDYHSKKIQDNISSLDYDSYLVELLVLRGNRGYGV